MPTPKSCPTRRCHRLGLPGPRLDYFTSIGITVERLISDNHYSYRRSNDVRETLVVWAC
jgi:hypothetical protein